MFRIIRPYLLLVICAATLTAPSLAQTIDSASDAVSIGPDAGTLSIVEGAMIGENADGLSIIATGSGVVNMTGGEAAGTAAISAGATATLSGGLIGNDLTLDGGTVTLSGTGRIEDDVRVSMGTFTLTGGGVVNDQFFATGSSSITLSDTAGPINDDLFIQETAKLSMAGAELGDELFVQNNATATISGGYIDDDLNANDDAVINVSFVEVDDSVDTSGNGVVNFADGIVNGGFEAGGNSTINISAGQFENILSDGEVILASGGTINISGGTFGTAGVDEGGPIGSSLGGTLNFSGGSVAGLAEGTAPTATFNAVLNGKTNVSAGQFDALVLEGGNSGVLNADNYSASSVSVNSIAAAEVNVLGGSADELEILAELGGFVRLEGGEFGSISAELNTEGVLTIVGTDFAFAGTPVEELDALLNDPGAFIEETGELRLIAGELTGTLADGNDFTLSFSREFIPLPGARVFLVIPEPSTSLLLIAGLGMVLPVRHRRKTL